MANALEDGFTFILDKVEVWFAAFRNSEGAADRLFAENSTVRARVRAATTLWFGAFFISIVISSPGYYRYGLAPEKVSFQLTAVLAQYCGLLALAWCFHRGLRRYGVQSNLADTFVLQTAVAAGLAPLFTLATLPGRLRMLEALHKASLSNPEPRFEVVLQRIFAPSVRPNTALEIADVIALPVVLGLIALGSARLIPILTKHYAVDTWRVIRSVAFASAVLAPIPVLITVILEVVLCYLYGTWPTKSP